MVVMPPVVLVALHPCWQARCWPATRQGIQLASHKAVQAQVTGAEPGLLRDKLTQEGSIHRQLEQQSFLK